MEQKDIRVLYNDSIPLASWRELLGNNYYASPFQTPEFYEFYNSVDNSSAHAIALGNSDSIKALTIITIQREPGIKEFFSRRAIIFGGPIFSKNDSYILDLLLSEIIKYLKNKVIYVEIRNFFDYNKYISLFKKYGFQYIPWRNIQIRSDEIQKIKANISNSRKRQINKALRNGVVWHEAISLEEVHSFYDILQNLYLFKIKKPLHSIIFFEEFYKRNLGKYLLVHYKRKIIGGVMCAVMPNKAIYEYYVCGLDREYKEQYPSVIATWAAIEYANQQHIPLFDFMGAGSPKKDYGVYEFKARFGGELVNYGRFLLVLNPFLFGIGKLGLRIISKSKY